MEGQLYAVICIILDRGLEPSEDFGIHGRFWNQSLVGTKGQLKFLLNQKYYLHFQLCKGVGALNL